MLINSLNFDLSVKRSWRCDLLNESGPALVFEGTFDVDVDHNSLGHIRKGTISREYYWLDRWFNIFEFRDAGGDLRNFYCNINMPPQLIDDELRYVDLEIDVVVWPDGRTEILDVDEFESAAAVHNFADDLKLKVDNAVAELLSMIERREPPFNLLENQ